MIKTRKCVWNISPYIPGKPSEEVERELGLKNVIKLASNENPLGPSPAALDAIIQKGFQVHIYPDGNCYYIKEAVARHLTVSEKNVIMGNGSNDVIKNIAETYIDPGDEVIIPYPSFSEYLIVTQLMGGKPVMVPLNSDYQHDLDGMLEAVTDKTKIIFICNPNNPTGTIITGEQLDRFMNKIPRDVLVVVDEAYYEYVDNKEFPDSIKYVREGKNVVVLRTFSKIHGLAGLRIGYGITTEEICSLVHRVIEAFNVNTIAQTAALASLKDKEHLRKSREVNRIGKEYLYQQFKQMGLKYVPSEANFILVDIGQDSRGIFQKMLQKGVIIRTGDIYGYPTFIRVTVGKPAENEIFIHTLKELIDCNS
ncbi:MAG: histidinol-phosphate transaminase [Bacillota bacterium]|jgi:histidinol-phosphate aminotransferase